MDTVHGARAQINAVEGRYTEKAFHNWYEPNQIDGITEMRRWNMPEVNLVRLILDTFESGNSLIPLEEAVTFLKENT